MAIIVEDGTGANPAANSYGDVEGFEAYAEARGVTLPATDAAKEQLLTKAMDWLNAQESRFKGRRVSATQPLSFPRNYLYIYDYPFANDTVPPMVITALYQLACEVSRGVDLMPTQRRDELRLASKTVGPLSRSWFPPGAGDGILPTLSAVESILDPVIDLSSSLRLVRI